MSSSSSSLLLFLFSCGLLLLCCFPLGSFPQRLPRDRPRPDSDYWCPVNPQIPKYVPRNKEPLVGNLLCPQSDTTNGLVDAWLKGFKDYHPNVTISVPINGSGIAGPCLMDKSCDCAIIAREMLLKEYIPYREKLGYDPVEVAVSGGSYRYLAFTDAITFFVNAENPILPQLTFPQIDAIFTKTRRRGYPTDITDWGQLFDVVGYTAVEEETINEWKKAPIKLYGVKVENGFEYFLNRTILLGGTWKDNIVTRDTVFEIASLVGKDKYGIGYSGIAYVNPEDNVKRISLSIDQHQPYYSGVIENICNRKYPLSRLVFTYTNREPGKLINPIVNEFIRYQLSYEGQIAVLFDRIFLPLTPQIIQASLQKLDP